MGGRENLEDLIIFLPLFLLTSTAYVTSAANSTPKNLVNLYTHSPADSSNLSGINNFQNEYQYRQGNTKPSNSERHRLPAWGSSQESMLDHLPADFTSNPSDYFYQDSRSTTNVPDCKGRLKLSGNRGFITDGPGYYQTNLQCIWLIDAGSNNATIRIQIHQFNTECNYDYLYVFDGDSIYSPLIAALSGDIKDFSPAFTSTRLESMISSETIYNNHTHPNISDSDDLTSTMVTSDNRPLEIKATSGKAFVYFHSDTAQSMPGFYMTYSIDSCPLDCSNRGECDYSTLECKCHPGFFGNGCQYLSCPNNCTSPESGFCDQGKYCRCMKGFLGPDCSTKSVQQGWKSLIAPNIKTPPRAFHQAALVDDMMWIIGGKTETINDRDLKKKSTSMILGFNITERRWIDFKMDGISGIDYLAEISGHSVARNSSRIYIFGGIAMNNTILSNLAIFDSKTRTLTSLSHNKRLKKLDEEFSVPLAVVGHSANIIDEHMYVFLGYNPVYGYLNLVQKFSLADGTWSLAERRGSSIGGCIGHTSTYDPVDRLVYVYGGHYTRQLSNLYSFDPQSEVWTILQSAPSPRYYHSSIIVNRQLLVLGGNSYNTSHHSDQCFQQTYLTYDLSCTQHPTTHLDHLNLNNQSCRRKCWRTIEALEQSVLKRHGHSVINHHNQLILFGGFNGLLMNDLRFFSINDCDSYLIETDCLRPLVGQVCAWNKNKNKCEPQYEPANLSSSAIELDPSSHNCSDLKQLQHFCEGRETCTDCLNTNAGCVWCGFLSQCQYNRCKLSGSKPLTEPSSCYRNDLVHSSLTAMNFGSHPIDIGVSQDSDDELECKRTENCNLCKSKSHCSWHNEGCSYSSPNIISSPITSLPSTSLEGNVNKTGLSNLTSIIDLPRDPFDRSVFTTWSNPHSSVFKPIYSCDTPCYLRRSCNECTTTKCIWCSTSEQCMDSSAYFAYHAMGQCMHYVAHSLKCPVASCADIETCSKCLTNPKCGWLNDISNTGKGRCIEGTSLGPSFDSSLVLNDSNNQTGMILPNWFYTSCPACQCNGHSYCRTNGSSCVQPCQDNTEGPHCDKCIQGYYGDPLNGGTCWPCRCNGHAQTCNRETGKCYCSTKGVIGHNCNRCDDQNHYISIFDVAGPLNVTCYYNLTTDYQYTFNMSKPEDHFYSDINFINVPLRRDSDVDFTIACSRLALVNITYGDTYNYRRRIPIHTNLECGSFRLRFPHERHLTLYDTYNQAFFVHVYKFQTPFILQIAFTQHRTLYLPQFFFTFSSCFLFFFAVTGLVWKLKHEYDSYVRRQRQFIEMEQLASRPFSTILLEVFKQSDSGTNKTSKPPGEPTPISFEPCFGSNVGVLSLFVQLPGRPGLAIGSALISLNDDTGAGSEDSSSTKILEKENSSL